MGKVKTLDKNINKDIELCRTTNERVSEHTAQILMNHQIPTATARQDAPSTSSIPFTDAVWSSAITRNYMR